MATLPQDDSDDLWIHDEAAKKVNALYANRLFAQPLNEGVIRISFGEMSDNIDPKYHSAIVVTPEMAVDFAEVIHRVAQAAIKAQQEYATAVREFEQEVGSNTGGANGN